MYEMPDTDEEVKLLLSAIYWLSRHHLENTLAHGWPPSPMGTRRTIRSQVTVISISIDCMVNTMGIQPLETVGNQWLMKTSRKSVHFGPNRISINSTTALRKIYATIANVQKSQVYGSFKQFFKHTDMSMTIIDRQREHAFKRRINAEALP